MFPRWQKNEQIWWHVIHWGICHVWNLFDKQQPSFTGFSFKNQSLQVTAVWRLP